MQFAMSQFPGGQLATAQASTYVTYPGGVVGLAPGQMQQPALPLGSGRVTSTALPRQPAPTVSVPTQVTAPGVGAGYPAPQASVPQPAQYQTQQALSARTPMAPPSSQFAQVTPVTKPRLLFSGNPTPDENDEEAWKIKGMCERIDADGNGFITKLELINAVQHDAEIAKFVMPGSLANRNMQVDADGLMVDELSFDAVDAAFDAIACGKQRINVNDFFDHFKAKANEVAPNSLETRAIFDMIDSDQDGSVSKLELIIALHKYDEVVSMVLPGLDGTQTMKDESTFDAVNCVFEAISGGKKRIDYADFEMHFGKTAHAHRHDSKHIDRSQVRVFIIGPGFGGKLNPRQGATISEAGFQVRWIHDIPNPEQPDFPVQPHLQKIKAAIDDFKPDVVCAASKGGIYVVRLWQTGYWRGPTVLINAHPTCVQLPENIPVVLAQGDRDEVYPKPRVDLEAIVASGSRDHTFLYYVPSSGELRPGVRSRNGDMHNMESLLTYDCLPRLIDATLCSDGPEAYMIRSWVDRLSDRRLESEEWLGYTPEQIRKRWASRQHRGYDDQKVFDVSPRSEEYNHVMCVFKAAPKETPAYMLGPQAAWEQGRVVRIQRIENGLQVDGSAKPYYDALRRSMKEQKVEFEPGVHTRWSFHGADGGAIESIINNPVVGVQPLVAGTRGAQLWGSGTYLARDAKYVAEGGFCGQPGPDGTRKMLMCLTTTGIPCAGDPQQRGLLPMRRNPHRYHCAVDSLSSPEIYIVQHAGAVLPAYVITFA